VRTIVAAAASAALVAFASPVGVAAPGLPADRAAWQQYGPVNVQVCHRTASPTRPYATLTIARVVLAAYLRRGATVGPCIYGSVTTGGTVFLRTWKGRLITALEPRRLYSIVVKDASRTENFHLSGERLDKKTSKAYRGTVRWKVSLEPGRCRYRSDSHPRLRRFFTARPASSA
jgi:hypothetical protein